MKLVFLVIAILINFFNHSLVKSEEKISSGNNKIENISKKESIKKEPKKGLFNRKSKAVQEDLLV